MNKKYNTKKSKKKTNKAWAVIDEEGGLNKDYGLIKCFTHKLDAINEAYGEDESVIRVEIKILKK